MALLKNNNRIYASYRAFAITPTICHTHIDPVWCEMSRQGCELCDADIDTVIITVALQYHYLIVIALLLLLSVCEG